VHTAGLVILTSLHGCVVSLQTAESIQVERPHVAGSHRSLLGELSAALKQQHGGFCSLQLCRNAISDTRAISLLLLLGLSHVPNQLAQELHGSCRTAALR